MSVSQSLTVEVAGEWTSSDFVSFFAAVDRLYVVLYRFGREGLPLRPGPPGELTGLGRITRAGVPPLSVGSVSYASPGTISLLGLGDVIEQLRELLKDLWGRNRQEKAGFALCLEARRAELDHAERMRDLEYLVARAAVVREMREAGRMAEVSAEELEDYLRRAFGDAVESLEELVEAGKVTAVRLPGG